MLVKPMLSHVLLADLTQWSLEEEILVYQYLLERPDWAGSNYQDYKINIQISKNILFNMGECDYVAKVYKIT